MSKKMTEDAFTQAATETTVATAMMDDTKEKKGDKYPVRVNFGFTTENAEYIKIMSKLSGKSITEFLNELLEDDRAINQEAIDAAAQLMNDVRSRRAARRRETT